jgi:hypothetical protein
MNTLLITTQIMCYGIGIVSASLNIATFVCAAAANGTACTRATR